MTRWILLGLADDEVDVISRLPRDEDPGDVMVYHPDPNALVLQLADLAELTRVDTLPEPDPGDVVIVGARDLNSTRAAAYRRAGARVVGTQELGPLLGTPPPTPIDTGAVEKPDLPLADSTAISGREDMSSAPRESFGPAPELWADPTQTLRWALASFGYPDAVLWWDGNEGVWVPWVSQKPSPREAQPGSPEGLRLETRWGRFVLTGVEEGSGRIHRGMLVRLAEDVAWRDLMDWEEAAQRLARLRPASRSTTLAAWEPWLDAALPLLAPAAALAWSEGDGGLRLARAWGDGVHLEGELRLPRPLFDATFGSSSSWRAWNLGGALRLVFLPSPDHSKWPLQLARLTRSSHGEAEG